MIPGPEDSSFYSLGGAFAEEVIQKAISGCNPERAIVSPAIAAAYLDST
jgi:hypothetical protein